MSTDDLRAAAERLMAAHDAERADPNHFWRREHDYANDLARDGMELAEAFLRDHPADDGEPMDAAWLRAAGAPETTDGDYSFFQFRLPLRVAGYDEAYPQLGVMCRPDGVVAAVCLDAWEDKEDGREIGAELDFPPPWTRGRFRRLCSALGTPLKETP